MTSFRARNGHSAHKGVAAHNGRNGTGGDAYRSAGIDYDVLDAGKRLALDQALLTSPLLAKRDAVAFDASRGESSFVLEVAGTTLAFVLEALGTKSIIARQVHSELGSNHFDDVAYDTVAAAVNDLCCVGALPLVVNAYFATGSSDWYSDPSRATALVKGWRSACTHAGCAWGGGESPTLPGLVTPDDIELAASVVGRVPDGRQPLFGDDLAPGDEIVLVQSTGLHANGASLARSVAEGLDDGYATRLPSGRTFGDALLAPTTIYAPLIEQIYEWQLPVSYISNITGHGFLKLMRAQKQLTYRIESVPRVPEVLEFLTGCTKMDQRAAYRTLNMGAGLAVYCSAGSGSRVVEAARSVGVDALLAGAVEEGPRRVVLEPFDVVYEGEDLRLGPTQDQAISS